MLYRGSVLRFFLLFFFFKQKTAYEIVSRDWSSDVCSSDLVVKVVFHTNQSPPVLRVDIRNPNQDTSLNDCERMSRNLEASLDAASIIPDAYVLEVSSPGISQQLQTDRKSVV